MKKTAVKTKQNTVVKTTWRLLVALLLSVAATTQAPAAGGMMIFPTMPFFVDGVRTQHINIANNSTTAATFRVELVRRKQEGDGSSRAAEMPVAPGEVDMKKVLIFSPRQVFLQPGDVQTIKLALRRPENFPEGEYRIDLKLSRLDNNIDDPGVGVTQTNKNAAFAKLSVQVGFAIPVVVRHGKSDAAASLSDFAIESGRGKNPQHLKFKISRTGRYSTMGKIAIYWTPAGSNEEKLVGASGVINVFPEVDSREVALPFDQGITVSGGTMRVVYSGNDDGPDKGVVFADQSFNTPR